jgi:hypothetical protein
LVGAGKKFPPERAVALSPSDWIRDRLADAIGGREKALSVEKSSGGRFQRKRLQSWIDGDTSPPVAELVEFAKFLGKEPGYFLVSTGEETIPVEKLDVRAAAGGGAVNNVLKTEETREFPLWMLQKLTKTARGKPSKLRLIRAAGDSMEPLIRGGALLLVDETARDPRSSPKPENQWDHTDVYVFLQEEQLRVKRLHVDPKGVTIALSENSSYGPEVLRKQDFKVLGRVIWWDNRL